MDSHSLHEEIRVTTKTQSKIERGTNKIEKGLKKTTTIKRNLHEIIIYAGQTEEQSSRETGI